MITSMSDIPVLELSDAELDDVSGGCGPPCVAAAVAVAMAAWLATSAGRRATETEIRRQREHELLMANIRLLQGGGY